MSSPEATLPGAPATAEAPAVGAPVPAGPDQGQSRNPEAVLAAVIAVVTGVSLLGWVTFIGGAILGIRADQAGLPATEAVAVTPKPVLLTTGAEAAAFAAIVGALVVAALFLWDGVLHARGAVTLRGARARLEWMERQIPLAEARVLQNEKTVQQLTELVRLLRAQGENAGAETNQRLLDDYQERAKRARASCERLKYERGMQEKEVGRVRERDRRLAAIVLGGFLFGVQAAIALFWASLSVGATLLALGVAALGTAICFLVLFNQRLPQRRIWFGVAAFLALSLFLATETYLRTRENPKVEPAAVLRAGAGPICGFFVAQTSDYLYVGTYERPVAVAPAQAGLGGAGSCVGSTEGGADQASGTQALPPRLMTVPNDEVTDLAIGPLMSLEDGIAARRSAAMALDLCQRRATSAASTVTKIRSSGCSGDDLRRLRALIRQGPAPAAK